MSGNIPGDLKAYGAWYQGQATKQSLDQQADIQEDNARAALEAGELDAQRQMIMAKGKIGGMTAAYGASGVTSNSGSMLEVIRSSYQNAELDNMNIKYGAKLRAINYENQASLNRAGGKSAMTAAYINMASAYVETGEKAAKAAAGGGAGG